MSKKKRQIPPECFTVKCFAVARFDGPEDSPVYAEYSDDSPLMDLLPMNGQHEWVACYRRVWVRKLRVKKSVERVA